VRDEETEKSKANFGLSKLWRSKKNRKKCKKHPLFDPPPPTSESSADYDTKDWLRRTPNRCGGEAGRGGFIFLCKGYFLSKKVLEAMIYLHVNQYHQMLSTRIFLKEDFVIQNPPSTPKPLQRSPEPTVATWALSMRRMDLVGKRRRQKGQRRVRQGYVWRRRRSLGWREKETPDEAIALCRRALSRPPPVVPISQSELCPYTRRHEKISIYLASLFFCFWTCWGC